MPPKADEKTPPVIAKIAIDQSVWASSPVRGSAPDGGAAGVVGVIGPSLVTVAVLVLFEFVASTPCTVAATVFTIAPVAARAAEIEVFTWIVSANPAGSAAARVHVTVWS